MSRRSWECSRGVDAAAVIDGVLGQARVRGEVSVGTYLVLAALNRICDPRSKAGLATWWAGTALGRILAIPTAALDHRRFWDAMDRVEVEQLDRIEEALTRRMIEVFGLDTHALILDMTNFATFIDSTNPRAPVAAGGQGETAALRPAHRRVGPGRHP
jgi:hypothetical protein